MHPVHEIDWPAKQALKRRLQSNESLERERFRMAAIEFYEEIDIAPPRVELAMSG